MEALRAGLRDVGYIEGKNIIIEFRWAMGILISSPELAAELVRLKVDDSVMDRSRVARGFRAAAADLR